MHVTDVKAVKAYPITNMAVRGVSVKYLLHKGMGATLQLTLFTIEVGGCTSAERHAHEHEVFMLRGKAVVEGKRVKAVLQPGTFVFIPTFEEHHFVNIGSEPVEFLCTRDTRDARSANGGLERGRC
jgi:quercetin dioxygenase-like cupin family protein